MATAEEEKGDEDADDEDEGEPGGGEAAAFARTLLSSSWSEESIAAVAWNLFPPATATPDGRVSMSEAG
jgi:hypothetical protein